MKREADGDMGSPQKRTRRGDEEVRLLIPSKVSEHFIRCLYNLILQLIVLVFCLSTACRLSTSSQPQVFEIVWK